MKKPSSTTADSSFEVGYGKPPKANQFPKGRTGNPRGKRKGEENIISAFKRIVSKRVKINDDEKVRTITLAEAVILKNYNVALQKNPFAMSNMFRLAEASGEFVDRTDAKQVGRPLLVPEKVKTIEEFLARFGRTVETE
jgi:uncharacterized 2Fe-2S/4Fe-4S cluster protein (DUF4445 family)